MGGTDSYLARHSAGAPLPPDPRALRVPLRPVGGVLGVTACGMTATGLSREVCLVAGFLARLLVISMSSPLVRTPGLSTGVARSAAAAGALRVRWSWPLPLRRAKALTRVRFNVAPLVVGYQGHKANTSLLNETWDLMINITTFDI